MRYSRDTIYKEKVKLVVCKGYIQGVMERKFIITLEKQMINSRELTMVSYDGIRTSLRCDGILGFKRGTYKQLHSSCFNKIPISNFNSCTWDLKKKDKILQCVGRFNDLEASHTNSQ